MLTKMEFLINMYSKILDKISSQYKRIAKSVLIIQKSRFLENEITLNVAKFPLH
jgi:hypothetical protein